MGFSRGIRARCYVLRRILRRAVMRYGRTLGFHAPFFYKLVDVLAETMGNVFPEIRAKKEHVKEVIRIEEEAFNKTLDNGLELFESILKIREFYLSNLSGISDLVDQLVTTIKLLPDNYEAGQKHAEKFKPLEEKLAQLLEGCPGPPFLRLVQS